MGRISMKLEGSAIKDIVAELDAVGDLEVKARGALIAGAEVLLPAMQAAAPVRAASNGGTHIRDKLEYRVRSNGGRPVAPVGAWDAPVAYFVEFGHGGPKPAPAHPFLEPAAASVEDAVLAAIKEELLKGL